MISPSQSDLSRNRNNSDALRAFELDPDYLHLNHGAFGAVPREVRLEQDRWRAAMERNPTAFFQVELPPALRRMAGCVAGRLGGRGDDWVFCENATAAANAVLQSLRLVPGDEILTTSHAYGAVLKAMVLTASRRGISLKIAELPHLLEDDEQVPRVLETALRPHTRLLVVDHITSPTATILPVQRIASLARAAGVPVLIDGAHAPGQLPLDVPEIGADWYTGNAHKWLFAPRGCGVLWTAPAWQEITRPAVLSHGTDQGYIAAFDWIGTRDPSPWLCFEAAGRAHDAFGGEALMARNRELANSAARELAAALQARISAPGTMRGAMAAMILRESSATAESAAAFRAALAEEYRIMAPTHAFAGKLWLRISAQLYNSPSDYEHLEVACRALLPRLT